MQNGKFIADVNALTPLGNAARLVLKLRFGGVAHYLPLAIHEAARDIEHVHQLRVSTRRARAALDLFDSCLPARIAKAARRQLRGIRRAAGETRDWDVFLETLGEIPAGSSRQNPGRNLLLGFALGQRRLAETHLVDLGDDCVHDFDEMQRELFAAIKPRRARQTLLQLGRPLLTEVAQNLEQALAGNLEDYGQLHQVRIAGKRLRYAMEIFAGRFASAFRDQLYPLIEEMQEILGLANDSHVALGRLSEVDAALALRRADDARRAAPGLEAVGQFHERRLREQCTEFSRWHERWRALGGVGKFLVV